MDLLLPLDAEAPKRAQLERRLREAIRAGRLKPGARLPPTRTLARDLGVSRGVVVEAYEQLVAEGWLTARRGAGTRVADHPATGPGPSHKLTSTPGPGPVPKTVEIGEGPDPHLGEGPGPLLGEGPGPGLEVRYDLRTGRPDLSAFPRALWHAALGRALRTLPDRELGYGDPRGFAGLRVALAEHLGRTRGVVADPAQIVVTGGTAPGLAVLFAHLRRQGARRVAVEDPGWRGPRRAAEHAGLEWTPVPVDAGGLVVDALPDDADVVVVTPAHQFPLGVVLAPGRRARLVDWARRRGALVVEDDYDAEYRYDREPVGALQGLDPDRVVYAGSVSKTLAPALRLGWLVAPTWLLPGLAREKDRADRGTPTLDQAALADLLARGDVDRHLRRTRRRYRARRDTLAAALGEHLPTARIEGASAGLHLLAWLDPHADETAIAVRAAERGVAVDRLTTSREQPPALLLGYAAEPEPALRRAAALLAEAAGQTRRSS